MESATSAPRPDKDVQAYFRRIHRDYQDSVARCSIASVHERIKALLAPHMRGLVLDMLARAACPILPRRTAGRSSPWTTFSSSSATAGRPAS